jgi:hypothetical protein
VHLVAREKSEWWEAGLNATKAGLHLKEPAQKKLRGETTFADDDIDKPYLSKRHTHL